MRDLLALLAGALLGSGIGLFAGRPLLGSLLQPLIISVLSVGSALLKPRSKYWASALALSTVSAVTAASLRSAVTALYLLATGDPAASLLHMLPETLPQELSAQAPLAPLLLASLALTVGQALLMDGFARLASPLWKGLEAVRPSVAPALEVGLLDLAVGAPLGALAAFADARLGLGYSLFAALLTAHSALATASTIIAHLPLLLLARSLGEVVVSLEVGVQIGVLTATAVAAFLLHAAGGAEAYRGVFVSLAAVMSGVLLLLMSFAALAGPQWAVYVTWVAVVTSFLSLLAVVRSEGGLLTPLLSPNPLVPSAVWLAWFYTVEWFGLNPRLAAIIVNPVLSSILALMAVWGSSLSDDGRAMVVSVVALVLPAALTLARNSARPEAAALPDYYAWRLPWGVRPNVDAAFVASTAAVVALLCVLVYYVLPPSSPASYARFLVDPSGLFFVYSFGRSLWGTAGEGYGAGGLALAAAAGVAVAARVVFIRKPDQGERLKAVARGALGAYWPIRALLALQW